ncbi:MAG: PD-(D/E)XK nuclease family protein [Armatimonadota bacterium]
MSRKILCGPAGSGKTRLVLNEYVSTINEHGEDAALLVLPSRLACERVRRRLVTDGRVRGLLDPRILTFPDLAQLLLDANHANVTRISDLQQRLLMREVVDDLCAEGALETLAPMCDFPGFIDALRQDVEEIKRTALRPDQFAHRLERAGGMSDRNREFCRVYARYQQRLQKLNLFDDAGRFWQARDILLKGNRRPFEDLRVILADGFDDFTTTQLQVLDELSTGVERLVISLCLESDESRRPELFSRPRRTLKRINEELGEIPQRWMQPSEAQGPLAAMGQRLFVEGAEPGLREGSEAVEVIEASGQRMEVRQVLVRVKRLLQKGVEPRRVCVIARDPGGYRRALSEIAAELGVPLNLQASEPAAARPSVQAVLDIVRVPANDLLATDVLRLVKSDYCGIRTQVSPDEIERICAAAKIIGGRPGPDGSATQHWAQRLRRYMRRLMEEQRIRREGDADEEQRWFRGSDEELAEERRLADRASADLLGIFASFEPFDRAQTLSEMIEALAAVMAEFGTLRLLTRHERGADGEIASQAAANLAAVNAFLDALRELAGAEEQLGVALEMTLAEFHDEMLRTAQTATFVPPGTGTGVLVIDAGQARQLEFDHVFVLGMTERQFPRVAREDALFGDEERRELARAGIPLDQRREAVQEDAFLFYSIAVSAHQRLTLSYPSTDAEGREALRSYYVDEVQRCFAGPVPCASYGLESQVPTPGEAASPRELLEGALFGAFGYDVLLDPATRDEARSALSAWGAAYESLPHLGEMIALQDRRTGREPLDEYDGCLGSGAAAEVARIYGPERRFSASALRQFGGCPYAFFADRVLRLDAIEEASEDVDRALLGNVVHRCLSVFFGRWREHREDLRIEPDDRDAAREVLDDVIDQIFRSEEALGTIGDEVIFGIEREKARSDLHAWLDYEIDEIQPEHTAWRTEQQFGYARTEPVRIGDGEEQVLVRGRVDRIDRVGDVDGAPAFAVYDYKTGSIPAKVRMTDGGDFQLPVYALAGWEIVDNPNAVCVDWGYYSIRRPIDLKNRPRKKDPIADIEAYIASASAWALAYAAAIRAGEFAPDSDGRCGSWCPFKGICRWDEFRFGRKQTGGQTDE